MTGGSGIAPFAPDDGQAFMEPVREAPVTVAVVDATFDTEGADRTHRRLEQAGYSVRDAVIPGVAPQEPTVVWWRARDDSGEAIELAELIGADDVRRIDGSTPRPVLEAVAGLVVQVGSKAP
jgi:hypothetical protein